ncbi:hypothetical protein [Aneurinibacillus tyrosinisolvens]|uniref:hypothetical protein n=1 Tax=Aneurinibacillus tyrosinisolvens TaxID=1443435 RepID=UPI00128E189C|nr:hypothetical protein [Aneurinibacillus tyrosinisolvens]
MDDLLAGDQDCGKLLPQVEQLMATNSNLSPVQQNTEKDMSVVPDALNMLFTSMMWVLGLAGPLFIFGILRRML